MLEPVNSSILVFDTSERNRKTIARFLSANYECTETSVATDASEMIANNDFAAIVAAAEDELAFEFVATAQFLSPSTPLILMTTNDSPRFIIEAFRSGAFDVLIKPFELEELDDSVIKAVAKSASVYARNAQFSRLEELVQESRDELAVSLEGLESSYGVTLKALIQALEARDAETHGHSERVVTFSLRLGHEVGLDRFQKRDLELGAMLHDIGKIGVPDEILRKPAKLNEREWQKMRQHPAHGHRILRDIEFLEGASRVVLQHHERWDGKGYPNGLRGNEIDITARVFAVADAFDAMTSDRVYSRGRSFEEAYEELKKYAGTQFDPQVVEAFNAVPDTDWIILHKRSLQEMKELKSFQMIVEDLVNSNENYETVH